MLFSIMLICGFVTTVLKQRNHTNALCLIITSLVAVLVYYNIALNKFRIGCIAPVKIRHSTSDTFLQVYEVELASVNKHDKDNDV